MQLKTLLTHNTGGEAVTFFGSTGDVTCDALKDEKHFRVLGEDDASFELVLGNAIDGDHAGKWRILHSYYESATKQGDQGEAEVETSDDATTVKLELELEAAGSEPKKLALKGTAKAKHCGDFGTGAKARPQADASAKVAGKEIQWQGATLTPGTPYHSVVLSTSPLDCKKGSFDGDIVLSISVSAKTKKPSIVGLRGRRLARQASGSGSDVEVTVDGGFEGDADTEAAVTLKGTPKVGSTALELDGKVQAIRCPE